NRGHWHLRGMSAQPPSATNGTQPMAVALADPAGQAWDIFLAVPMAVLSPEAYKQQRTDLMKVVCTLRKDWGGRHVYYPAEDIPGAQKFDQPDMAMRRGLNAVANSRIFIMIYSVDKSKDGRGSYGRALATRVPSRSYSMSIVTVGKENAAPIDLYYEDHGSGS